MRVVAIYNRHIERGDRRVQVRQRRTRAGRRRHAERARRGDRRRTAGRHRRRVAARALRRTSTCSSKRPARSNSARSVILEAFKHGKDVVLLNAEIDATIGPILQVYAAKHGVILSACDGDEPGVQMNLFRWVRGLGLIPACHRQHQGSPGSVSHTRPRRRDSPRSGARTPRW